MRIGSTKKGSARRDRCLRILPGAGRGRDHHRRRRRGAGRLRRPPRAHLRPRRDPPPRHRSGPDPDAGSSSGTPTTSRPSPRPAGHLRRVLDRVGRACARSTPSSSPGWSASRRSTAPGPTDVSETWLSVGWGAVRRLDIEQATCSDPECEADHGYTGALVGDDLTVRMSSAADGPDRVHPAGAVRELVCSERPRYEPAVRGSRISRRPSSGSGRARGRVGLGAGSASSASARAATRWCCRRTTTPRWPT